MEIIAPLIVKLEKFTEQYEKFWLGQKIFFSVVLIVVNFLSGTQVGYGFGLTGASLPSIIVDEANKEFLVNGTSAAFLQSFYPGAYIFGNALGPILSPISIFYIGFKYTLISWSIIAILGQVFSVFSVHYVMLCIGRLICGTASGIISAAGIGYSTSLAPPKIRGIVGAMFLFGLTFAVLMANITTFFALVTYNWRYMVALGVIPPSLLLAVGIFIPESPIWRQEKIDSAQPEQKENEDKSDFLTILKKIMTIKNIWRLFLCFVLTISIQLGGLVPIIFFLPLTIRSAGLTDFFHIALASIGVAVWNIITSLIPVLFVDFVGRKILLTFGYIIMFISTLSLGFIVYFLPSPWSGIFSIVLIFVFLFGNNGGINSIIFFLYNELFTPDVTLLTSAWNLFLFNFVSFLVGFLYLWIQSFVGLPGMLWIFSGFTLVTGSFLTCFLPETKVRKSKKKKEILEDATAIVATELSAIEEKLEEKNQDLAEIGDVKLTEEKDDGNSEERVNEQPGRDVDKEVNGSLDPTAVHAEEIIEDVSVVGATELEANEISGKLGEKQDVAEIGAELTSKEVTSSEATVQQDRPTDEVSKETGTVEDFISN